MTTYKNELTIDFGDAGGYLMSWGVFRVRLDSSQLSELIDDAANAYRVYELMLINRPGDVWNYVSVVIEAAPQSVFDRVKHVREKGKSGSSEYLWSAENVPFIVFDKIFYWDIDYTEPADEAWITHRNAPALNKYAEQLLGFIRTAKNRLGWHDELIRHIVSRVKSVNHPYDFLEREAAIEYGRRGPRPPRQTEPEHTEDFYKKLRELLCEDLVSVAYIAGDDYTILQMLATEQRTRANRTQHSPDRALQINTVHDFDCCKAWDSTINCFTDGIGYGDLFIQGYGFLGHPLDEDSDSGPLGRYFLSVRDEGDNQRFSKTSGDGWFLYTRKKPNDRRSSLEYIRDWGRYQSSMGAVLSFERGATLFGHEKALFFVGEDVDTSAREALAVLIADWEAHSGEPVLVVMGDTQAFEAQKCCSLFEIPTSLTSHEAKRQWLSDLICMKRPWMDAIFALDAPSWAAAELNWRAEYARPWRPWVVSTSVIKELQASYLIQGELAKALREAHQRAKSTRSQMF